MTTKDLELKQGNGMNTLAHTTVLSPAADIYETPDAYVVMMDMPGALKESINVTIQEGTLAVKGHSAPTHHDEGAVLVRELRPVRYERSFTIGEGVDRNNVDARYEEGVLTVKLLKHESVKPREITVH